VLMSLFIFCTYEQTAAKKRCKRHMSETDEFVSSTNDGFLMDPLTLGAAYQKMKALCMNISNEVRTDIAIHNQHVLPRFVIRKGKTRSSKNVVSRTEETFGGIVVG
jgi:hypothetical protein